MPQERWEKLRRVLGVVRTVETCLVTPAWLKTFSSATASARQMQLFRIMLYLALANFILSSARFRKFFRTRTGGPLTCSTFSALDWASANAWQGSAVTVHLKPTSHTVGIKATTMAMVVSHGGSRVQRLFLYGLKRCLHYISLPGLAI
jgi:hypothetical protein